MQQSPNLPNPPKRPRLLLLEPYSSWHLREIHDIRMLFLSNGWEVQKLNPNQKTFHEKGVLCIPDTGGLNGCMAEFFGKDSWLPPNIPPQDQGVEWFRLNRLHYYINKEMPILGIGYSAFLIFAHVLKGKLNYGDDGVSIGATAHKIISDDSGFYSYNEGAPICAGLYAPSIDEGLIVTADRLLKHGGKGLGVAEKTSPQPIKV